jgi:alpha/beta superfamily hydrolase
VSVRRIIAGPALALLLVAAPAFAQQRPAPPPPPGGQRPSPNAFGTAIELTPRPGVSLRAAAFAPDGAARGAVILFVGGPGKIAIPDRPAPGWQMQETSNFLARTRELFRKRGLYTVVVDAPSDQSHGLINNFRLGAAHATDSAALIAEVRRRASGVPVWLVGTSRGSISAAAVAARLAERGGPDGIVLTSSVTRPGGGTMRDTVMDTELAAIRVPALVVYHRADGCEASPASDAGSLLGKLSKAPRKETLLFDGGAPPRPGPGDPGSAHGYLGIEDQVVGAIVDWMFAGAKG